MRSKILFSALLSAGLSIGACSTTPDPAEICSAEWIEPRIERAVNEFERDTRKIFRKFRKAADSLQDGGNIGPLQMLSVMNAVSALADKFENAQAVQDMRLLAQTCDEPELIKNAMTGFMRKKGLPDIFIGFINEIDAYKDLLNTDIRKPAHI